MLKLVVTEEYVQIPHERDISQDFKFLNVFMRWTLCKAEDGNPLSYMRIVPVQV